MNLNLLRNRIKRTTTGYFFLLFLSKIYFLVVKIKEWMYEKSILKANKVSVPVICVGNISAGGTGKTSLVIMIARELANLNKKVAIIVRGYKKHEKTYKNILIDNDDFSPDMCGDEAKLIYLSLKSFNIPVVVNSNRVKAAKFVVERFRPDIILMDDGFQHFSISKDLNIVLINSSEDCQQNLLPLGNLREDFNSLKRANMVILTHCENSSQLKIDKWISLIREKTNKIPILESMHSPNFFLNAFNFEKCDVSFFKDKEVVLLSAIGDPDSFETNIKNLGAKVKKCWIFPDHYRYTLNDIITIENIRNNLPVITTYKDFVKFPAGWSEILKKEVYIFSIKITFLGNGYKIILDKIMEKIK